MRNRVISPTDIEPRTRPVGVVVFTKLHAGGVRGAP